MTRKNKLERAGEIGVSMPTLKSWERSGVDIWSDDDVRKKLGRMRNMPPHLKPEFQPKANAPIAMAGDDPTQIDIETIISQLSAATDKHQAQTVKIQIDGLLNAYKLREAAGQYVSKAMVEEALMRIAAAVKAAVRRMEADLPPMLEGADPAAMQRIIREKADQVMTTLSDATAEVWRADDAGD
jgi:flagellar biosynthesis/type III secretory pathway protein FliH